MREKEVFFGLEDNILKQIFFDEHKNWDKFVDKYGKRIRPIVTGMG